MIAILAAALGILVASRLPALPLASWHPSEAWLASIVLFMPVPLLLRSRHARFIVCFCLGLSYGIVSGHVLVARQLPPELEGEELLVSGVVSGLPEDRGRYQRFRFQISEFHNLNPAFARKHAVPEHVLLSWYDSPELAVAQQWTLKLKLSRPRGFVNTGGFDYQRWLLSSGVGATGYVRPSTLNRLHGEAAGVHVQKHREAIRGWIAGAYDSRVNALLLALAVGDTAGISPPQWDLLRATGTNHLMAISGLHIGLLAFVGYWLGHLLRAVVSLRSAGSRWLYWLPGLLSCAAAALYSALAGFALPTQRALTMVVLVNLALVLSRSGGSMRALAWAMLVVLVLDPLAGYDLGFWMSFGAVAFLLFHFQHRLRRNGSASPGLVRALLGRVAVFGRAQWVVFVGLTIPLLALNQPLGLLSPVANFFAIPVVSFAVVVPLLAGIALRPLSENLAAALVGLAGESLEICMTVLGKLADAFSDPGWVPAGAAPEALALVLAGAGVLLLLAPRGIPARWLGGLLVLPLLLPAAVPRPPLMVTVLDVGQGLATVVTTENHVLVYDTGPAYSERFNAAEAVIAPHLRARGLHRIDRLVVSHGDSDHAGGVRELLASLPTGDLLAGETLPASEVGNTPAALCDRDAQWRWDDVTFQLIEPRIPTGNSNDHSCILLVEFAGRRILLPGDIATVVENSLLQHHQLPADIDLLIAPHHGSNSSSGSAFVNFLRPRHVVFSAAYRSPHGHPHEEVTARYAAVGSRRYDTGHTGELNFSWDRQGQLQVRALRRAEKRYWYAESGDEF
jgi:competence protein ComEC